MSILEALSRGARGSIATILSAMAEPAEVAGLSLAFDGERARLRAAFEIVVLGGSQRSLVFRLGRTGGTLLAVRAEGCRSSQITGTALAATQGLVVVDSEDPERERLVVEFDLSLREGPASTVQLPFGLPYLADPARPLRPWDRVPPPIVVRGEVHQGIVGGILEDRGLLAGWASLGEPEVIQEVPGFQFLGTRTLLASLTPYSAHNLSRLLTAASDVFADAVHLPTTTQYLLISRGETSPADDPTTGAPIISIQEDDIPDVSGAEPSLAPFLWAMSRAVWGGACHIGGKGGSALEVGLAGYLTIAALRRAREDTKAVLIQRHLQQHLGRRVAAQRRRANRLTLELAASDSPALLQDVSDLAAQAWGQVVAVEDAKRVLRPYGIP